ncbi:hypothetical protein RhiJN_24780 [Ceratobasidium sp. AG-Ba]|nr:hypothetical protein RhiJN_24780 [Ceratobasidium sp. AG-Ba]
MLEPIVKELLELHSGVELRVRTGDPAVYERCMVHADLCHHIADLIARIKIGGGAGVASELNFCLYCRSRLSSISVPAGFIRANFPYRDPMEDLQNAYFWRSLESGEDQELFFEETGNRFTILHLLPGWHTSSCSPPDAMHLLYLGAANWILKQVVMGPNLLAPRLPNSPNPVDVYNAALEDDLWLPYSVGRLPPKLGQSRGRIKADQLKLMSKLMFVLFYLAMRDGDDLSEVNAPRGTKSSTGGKHQLKRAKLLHKLRLKHFTTIGRPHLAPSLAECFPSRSLTRHYRQILRFCVATSILDSRAISPAMICFSQNLLEALAVEYTRMNVQLSPTFHYMQHLEDSMLQTGSLGNTHVWAMERANGDVSKIRHNGRGKGVLEGTLMRGWWEHASLQKLIQRFRALPNRTPADEAIIDDLFPGPHMPDSMEFKNQLVSRTNQHPFVWTELYGVLLSISATRFGLTLSLTGYAMARIIIHRGNVHAMAILMAASCAAFLYPRSGTGIPVAYMAHLGAQHWEYNQLSELVAIPVKDFSGIFALLRVPMSYGEYWVTVSLNNLEPEEEDHNDYDEGEWIRWCVFTVL